MNTKNHLQFSENGAEVKVMFGGGTESISYSTKADALEAITGLLAGKSKKNQITQSEFNEMRDAIMAAENLPWQEERSKRGFGGTIVMGGGGLLGSLLFETLLSGRLGDILDIPDEPVKEACFKMCTCGRHGRIITQTHITGDFKTKKDGHEYIAKLTDENLITAEEAVKLTSEIDSSELPVGKKEETNA